MVVVATIEYLVIRLSVVGREADSRQGQCQLVASDKGFVEQLEAIAGNTRRHKVQMGASLGRIVAVGGVVDESQRGIHQSASLQR